MNGRLVYVVGPSGAGKDALLDYACAHLPPQANVQFARRWGTRPADAGGEAHHAISHAEFERMAASGEFSMHWRANGNGYGIGQEIRQWLDEGATVVVSGSREHLPRAMCDFPGLTVISVVVAPGVLRARLEKRGRESSVEIDNRLARAERFQIPPDVHAVEIRNDAAIANAGSEMVRAILG